MIDVCRRKADVRLHGKGNSELPWRKAGQQRHLVDVVDSDQYVVNKELSLCGRGGADLPGVQVAEEVVDREGGSALQHAHHLV